jgi:hypothetical protein
MRAIDRRLSRLEDLLAPEENEEVRRLVELLLARRRRRAEEAGEPSEERRFEALTDDQNRPLSIVTSCGAGVDASQ